MKSFNEVTIDNTNGAGAVPYNKDVDYFGLRVRMKPSMFLKLALPLGQEHSKELEKYIADGGAIGSPFLELKIPAEWDDGDFSKFARVVNHEGRNRMTAILALEGDAAIEVHLLPRGGYRARDLTPEFIKRMSEGLYAQGGELISGHIFDSSIKEDAIKLEPQGNRVKEFIDLLYSKYPVWPMNSNQRAMVWGTGEDQQFAIFELKPSLSKKNSVEVVWFAAHPLRQGVGSRAMKELQAQAKEFGVGLTLFPWDKGQVSQAKLMKFYKQQGFTPTQKGGKSMAWEDINEGFDQPYPIEWESSGDTHDAIATLSDGTYLSIMFSPDPMIGKSEIDVEFHRNGSQELTGEGDAYRVFATVLTAIQEYVKKRKPKRLQFQASKETTYGGKIPNPESRAKLYDRMVQRYARAWGYRAFRADTGKLVRYELSRIYNNGKVNEGGWASVDTQNTVITPHVIEEAVKLLAMFADSYNKWETANTLELPITMGNPVGSGTYYKRDLKQDPTREYGDVDVMCFIPSLPAQPAAQRISDYREAIKSFCQTTSAFSTENGTNVIMDTSAGKVQVDLIMTFHEHKNWAKVLAPEYRVKGVISTSLTSSLAELLNLSFGTQGIQVKTRNGQPVSFRQSKDTTLTTVSNNPENWGGDIFTYFYQLEHGQAPKVPDNLAKHGGYKDEQRLSDIVLTIKALALDMQQAQLLGNGALSHITDKQDLIRKVTAIYSDKLDAALNSSKFDKAATPAAVEKANKTKLMLAKYRNEITKLLLN